MYLVEIEAGREALYESADALTSAIRRGDIRPESRIFHRATSSWISITLHPAFKQATAHHGEPLPPLARNQWTFFGLEPKSPASAEPADVTDDADPAPEVVTELGGGLKRLLGRALRSFSATLRTSEPSGS